MAPGGSFSAIMAAARAGADAVYFGVGGLNARANADNLTTDQLPEIIRNLHARSVKGYLALNILLTNRELDPAVSLAQAAVQAGIDGIIVQDIGLAQVLSDKLPGTPLHSSTQMTVTDEAGLVMAARMGFARVVLPRELNLQSVRRLAKAASDLNLETELFVHGALCICCSGQCLFSSMQGNGRSANRGQCAQPCRLNYRLANDKADRGKADGQASLSTEYAPLISPRDQALIKYLPQLADAGISSLKIEGRMRSASYVYTVTSEYRKALDSLGPVKQEPVDLEALLLAFNRGGDFTDRYLTGDVDKPFLTGSYPGSYGVEIGQITALKSALGIVEIMMSSSLPRLPARKDVLSVRRQGLANELASAPIGSIEQRGRILQVKGFHPDIISRFRIGDQVFRMTDEAAVRQMERIPGRNTPVKAILKVIEESPESVELELELRVTDLIYKDHSTRVFRKFAKTAGFTTSDRIRQQLGKTGTSGLKVIQIDLDAGSSQGLHLGIAQLNSMRRDAIEQLIDLLSKPDSCHSNGSQVLADVSGQAGLISAELESAESITKKTDESSVEVFADKVGIEAWYQRLPDDYSEIACGADKYILPLWSLNQQTAPDIVRNIRTYEADSRIFAWMPAAPQNDLELWAVKSISLLKEWGLDGLCSGHPGLDYLPIHKLRLLVDDTANITNSASCRRYLKLEPESLSFSPELSLAETISIFEEVAEDWPAETALSLSVYGRQRLMSMFFCPVGHNKPGCKKCHTELTATRPDQAKMYDFYDRQKQKMALQTHPLFCTSDLLSSYLLLDQTAMETATSISTGAKKVPVSMRLRFLDESLSQKTDLVRAVRKAASTSQDAHSRDQLIDIVQKTATENQLTIRMEKGEVYG